MATNKNDIDALQILVDNDQEYNKWKVYNSPTIVDVLEEFSSAKISLAFMITHLPPLKARYYSISSSPKVYPNEIHLTVAFLEYKTKDGSGPFRKGVCTSWLDQLNIGDIVPCYVKKCNKLRLPNTQNPIILVGPGTGIAPFRGFWQELHFIRKLQQNGTKVAYPEVDLYTGCRSPELDVLFYNELETMKKEGVLSNVHHAFSRIPKKPKTYVQDLLKKNGCHIYDMICKQNGHIFVCGGIEMAKDVKQTIAEIMKEYSSTSKDEHIQTIEHLKIDGRYHEEVFGVAFHGERVTKNENLPKDEIIEELKKKILSMNHNEESVDKMMNGSHYGVPSKVSNNASLVTVN